MHEPARDLFAACACPGPVEGSRAAALFLPELPPEPPSAEQRRSLAKLVAEAHERSVIARDRLISPKPATREIGAADARRAAELWQAAANRFEACPEPVEGGRNRP